jgi:hypothetical protein
MKKKEEEERKERSGSLVPWVLPVILAAGDIEIWRITVGGQAKTFTRPPSQPRKAWHGGTHLSSYLCGKPK